MDRSRAARSLAHTLVNFYVKKTHRDDKWCAPRSFARRQSAPGRVPVTRKVLIARPQFMSPGAKCASWTRHTVIVSSTFCMVAKSYLYIRTE